MKFNLFSNSVSIFLTMCFVLGISVMQYGCRKPIPTIEGIDIEAWKEDKNACGDVRTTASDALLDQKNKLLALSEMEIVDVLGRPDVNELSDRNQKFFYYFLEPGPPCPGADTTRMAKRLAIRFNAMGLAKEIRVEQQYAVYQ